ncbi:MAG: PilW family protein [Panacagrimonas sp.]
MTVQRRRPSFCRTPVTASRRQHGFSLVEMMIATVIGLIIMAGVLSVFLGSKQAFRTQEGMSQIQEGGRFIAYLVSPYVRLAGYLPDPRAQTDPAQHFRGSWRAIFGSNDAFFPGGPITGNTSVKPGTDALMVTYTADQGLRNCLNVGVSDKHLVTNVFYVSAPDATGLSSLNCGAGELAAGADPESAIGIKSLGPQPLIQGVQDMQILYGEDTDAADDDTLDRDASGLFPNRYVNADAVSDWERVVSVRITLTIEGVDRTEGNLTVGDGSGKVQDDLVSGGRIRRSFTTTISIRNRLRA